MTDRTWHYPRYAVIPTTGRDCLYQCLDAIRPQVDRVLGIWAPRYEAEEDWEHGPPDPDLLVGTVEIHEQRNISRWWNMGIDAAKQAALEEGVTRWDVAVLNDDAIVSADWFNKVATTMRSMNVAAASMGPVRLPVLHTRPGSTRLDQRMAGFAFILAGELGVRADETMQWWCGDNDIDMQSRLKGGTVILPDNGVKHLYPDQGTTGTLAARTAIDMQRFVDKWGFRPWNF